MLWFVIGHWPFWGRGWRKANWIQTSFWHLWSSVCRIYFYTFQVIVQWFYWRNMRERCMIPTASALCALRLQHQPHNSIRYLYSSASLAHLLWEIVWWIVQCCVHYELVPHKASSRTAQCVCKSEWRGLAPQHYSNTEKSMWKDFEEQVSSVISIYGKKNNSVVTVHVLHI